MKIVWEIEQGATRDSEKVIWHGSDVNVNGVPIGQLFKVPKRGEKPWQFECSGVCVRGQDNALEIHTRPSDVSGN